MDLATAFGETLQIANNASDAELGWENLYGYLCSKTGKPLPDLDSIQISKDIDDVCLEIEQLMQSHPPPSSIDAIYFGLFDTENDTGIEGVGYYIAGVSGFALRAPGATLRHCVLDSRSAAQARHAD